MEPENKTPEITDNKEVIETKTPEVKTNEEQGEKNDVVKNLNIALKQERDSKKDLLTKLKAFEDEKKAIEEQKMAENWEYEKLLAQYKADMEALKDKATKYDLYEQKKAEDLTKELTSLEKELWDNVKTKYSTILSKLDVEGQVSFYKTLKDDLKINDFSTQPKKGSEKLDIEAKKEELIKKWDVLWVLKLMK